MGKRTELINLRKKQNLSQFEVAKYLNLTRSAYSNYEYGYRNFKFETVIKLKKLFGVTEDKYFIKDELIKEEK